MSCYRSPFNEDITRHSPMSRDGAHAAAEYTVTVQEGSPNQRKNAATGASAAGTRAVLTQFLAFYFRAPIKAFFRSRVDYLVRP